LGEPSKGVPSALTAPLPITVRPTMKVGFSFSAQARLSAARIWSKSWPSTVSVRQPQASYFLAVSSDMVSLVICESCTSFES
jgi:hypothetical protein